MAGRTKTSTSWAAYATNNRAIHFGRGLTESGYDSTANEPSHVDLPFTDVATLCYSPCNQASTPTDRPFYKRLFMYWKSLII